MADVEPEILKYIPDCDISTVTPIFSRSSKTMAPVFLGLVT